MLEKFAWKGGYGAFSIGKSQVDEIASTLNFVIERAFFDFPVTHRFTNDPYNWYYSLTLSDGE